MELKIYWTNFAKKELHNIFKYYKEIAGVNVARKLVIGITTESVKLSKQPTIGQIEELLKNSDNEFRYLVFKSYKIIYWLNPEANAIEILDVFDTRQSPVKIRRTK